MGHLITTADNKSMFIPDAILDQAPKLKLFCRLLGIAQSNVIAKKQEDKFFNAKMRFTEQEVSIFLEALEDFQSIDYDKNINTIMTLAHAFGACPLYAFCVSSYLAKLKLHDLDKGYIMPLLKTVTSNETYGSILSSFVSSKQSSWIKKETAEIEDIPVMKNNLGYCLVNQNELSQPGSSTTLFEQGTLIKHQNYAVFDKNKNIVCKFKTYNWEVYRRALQQAGKSFMHQYIQAPYLFKNNPYIFFHPTTTDDYPQSIMFCNFEQKVEIALFKGDRAHISDDEKYIAFASLPALNTSIEIYNIQNINNIQSKIITCNDIGHDLTFMDEPFFSFDSNQFIVKAYKEERKPLIVHWNMSDFNWEDERSLPPCNILSMEHNARIRFTNNSKCLLLISQDRQYLEIIDLNDGHHKIMPGCWDISKDFLINRINKAKTGYPFFIYMRQAIDSPNFDFDHHYSYTNEWNDHSILYVDNYLGLNCAETQNTVLLKYCKENTSTVDVTHDIIGKIVSINKKGWVLTSPYHNASCAQPKQLLLFDNKGRLLKQLDQDEDLLEIKLSPDGQHLRMFKKDYTLLLKKIGENVSQFPFFDPAKNINKIIEVVLSKERCKRLCDMYNHKTLYVMPLYTPDDLQSCQLLCDQSNCSQYAYLDTRCSGGQHNTPLLMHVHQSFTPTQQAFIEDKLLPKS